MSELFDDFLPLFSYTDLSSHAYLNLLDKLSTL